MATLQIKRASGIARFAAVLGVVLIGALVIVTRGSAQPGDTMSPAQVREALRLAIDSYKNRDFEKAAGFFEYAKSGQQSLSQAEQKDLATFGAYNAAAWQAQQDGAAQIRLAQEAHKNGKLSEAVSLLNALNSNQNLSAADRQTLAELNKAMQAKATPTGPPPGKMDGKQLLAAGRAALQAGDFEAADSYASQAEKANSLVPTWLQFWSGDSPAKLHRDIQTAKAKQPVPANPAPKTESTSGGLLNGLWPFGGSKKDNDGPAPGGKGEAEMARQMIRDGFLFLEANDIEKARLIAFETKKLHVKWEANERTPDQLMQEIQRRTGGLELPIAKNEAPAHAEKKTETPKFADARAMVRYAREMLKQKKYEEADKVCTMALNTPTRWGLFEDNPEKLRRDIGAARQVSDRDESVKLMVEARKLLAAGNIDEAEKKAYRAKQLHTSNGVFDFGDRPDKLIDEVNRAKQARGKDSPNPLETKKEFAKSPLEPAGIQNANKNRAIVMLREARELERQGMLWEARQKALEARAFRAPFTPDEESPEHVLMSLSARCDRQISTHLQAAVELLGNTADAQRVEKSQGQVMAARKLAQAFELDASRVEQTAQHLHQVVIGSRPLQTVAVSIPGGSDPFKVDQAKLEPSTGDPKKDELRRLGREKLQFAQRELTAGKYGIARKLAEEAHQPQYGIQEEVQRFVRTINAEEYNQQLLEAKRNFDVGLDALAGKDYKKAMFILQQIDPLLLPEQYQVRMRDIMSMREMQPIRLVQGEQSLIKGGKIEERPTYDPPANPQDDLIGTVRAQESVLQQALRQRGSDALKKAHELWKQNQRDEAIKTLRGYIEQVNNSQLDTPKSNDLRRPIETRLQQYMVMQNERVLTTAAAGERIVKFHNEGANVEKNRKKQEELVKMLQEGHELYKNNKLADAQKIAKQVLEIDRDNAPALMLYTMTQTKINQQEYDRDMHGNEKWMERALSPGLGTYLDSKNPVEFDRERIARRKEGEGHIYHELKDPKERKIQYRLKQPISFNFKDAPLQQVIQDLSVLSNVQVVPDTRALEEARVNMSSLLSANVQDVDMKFALNILLSPLKLTYIIEDQVLKITTENRTIGRLVRVTYPIGDLIVPVEDHPLDPVLNMTEAIKRSMMPVGFYPTQTMVPQYGMATPVSSHGPGGLAGAFGSQNPNSGSQSPGQKERTKDEIARVLKDLIMNTVAKEKWEEMGGTGSIQYFPMGLALVINQPQEVQEEIQLLLATLRKLQDLQVSVELRAVLVSETFFERIGLDFDMNIRTPTNQREGSLVTGNFVPAPFVNRFGSGIQGLVSGLTPAGTFTPDLNVPIRNSTFNFTTPQFGGYQPEAGLSLGLAFLSDIQVFMFLEAVQGDRRAHIMQAPKISVYNGQQATIGGFMLRPTVSGVIPAPLANGNVILIPNITPMPFGLTMTVQPVVSPDRRFIRLNVTPQLAQGGIQDPAGAIVIAVPQQFPGIFDGGVQQPPLPTGPLNVTVNPTTANLLIANTTVNVPDGGTVLLGGFKFLAEERTEYGPPILSKIPYLSRLFRNVGWSRDGSTLIYLVTARVIMIEEEEGLFMGTIPPIPGR